MILLSQPQKAPNTIEEAIVLDQGMRRLREKIARAAASPLSVMICGETGSGKEVAAEWLHRNSHRASRTLFKINCATLSDALMDSELFGHEKGAFTGADRERQGVFEAADGGSLFLDEVAELSPRAQAKLLRVLESGEILRVGSRITRTVDVRIIAATHRNLDRLAADGHFREDLYFRLSGIVLTIPPLRERKTEIVPLALSFIDRSARTLGESRPQLSSDCIEALLAHPWPGNIRELRHTIERAVVMCRDGIIDVQDLELRNLVQAVMPWETPPRPATEQPPPSSSGMRDQVQAFEKRQILKALQMTSGHQGHAASLLGVSRRTLTNKLNAYGIARPRKAVPSKMGASDEE